MIDPGLLIVSGVMFIGVGLMTILSGALTFRGIFEEPPQKKDYSMIIGVILVIIGFALVVPGAILQDEKQQNEMNELCESIDMEFLKKSNGGLFGNSYVLCYDKLNKDLREIPL